MRRVLLDLLSSLLLGKGLLLLLSPIALAWFIHGNSERYLWIIRGPYPFSHFGGGPFQIALFTLLIGGGLLCIGIALLIRRTLR